MIIKYFCQRCGKPFSTQEMCHQHQESCMQKTLEQVYNEIFSSGSQPDRQFQKQDLIEEKHGEKIGKYLYLYNVLPGGINIIDNNGYFVLIDQQEILQNGACIGTKVDLSSFDVVGIWKIRYNRGMRGQQGDVPMSENGIISKELDEELKKYSLVFN